MPQNQNLDPSVKDLKSSKLALEQHITDVLRRFEDDFDVHVISINYDRIDITELEGDPKFFGSVKLYFTV